MRVITKGLLFGALLLMPMGTATASAQTVDEIIEKAIAAEGGRAALAKVTSRSTKGTLTVSTPGGDLSGPIEVVNQAPNKTRSLVTIDLSSMGAGTVVIEERFDGTTGYRMDSMQGNTDITGNNLESLRNATFPSSWVGFKDRGTKVDLAGKEKVNGRDTVVLLTTPKAGPTSKMWLDAETFLPVKAQSMVDVPGMGPMEQAIEFSDFREVDGLKIPHVLKGTSAVQSFTITVSKVEHNVKIDPTLFAKPVK